MRLGHALVMVVLAACGGGGTTHEPGLDGSTSVSVVRGAYVGAWRHDPIQFSLVPAVRTESLTTETVVVTAGGAPIAAELTVTQVDGGTVVVIDVDWGVPEPVAPIEVTVELASSITGMNGERFDGDSWSITYDDWAAQRIADPELRSPPSIAVGPDGTAYVACFEGDPTTSGASKLALWGRAPGDRWGTDIGANINGYPWSEPVVVVDTQGRTVLAWLDADYPNGVNATLHVRRESDSLVGTLDILPSVVPVLRIRMLEVAGTLVVAWSSQGTIRVARWSDVTSEWTRIAELTPISGASDFDVAFDGMTVVLAYIKNANPDGVHVAKQLTYSTWNEATPQYRVVASAALQPAITISSGVAHVAWREGRAAQNDAITARVDLQTMAVTDVAGQLEDIADDDVGNIDLLTSSAGQVFAAFTQAGVLRLGRATSTGWETFSSDVITGGRVDMTVAAHGHPVLVHNGGSSSPAELGVAYGNNISSP